MTYKPKFPGALLDYVKGQEPVSLGSASVRANFVGPTMPVDGICGWTIHTQAPGPQSAGDGVGVKLLAYTANAANSVAGFCEDLTATNGLSRVLWGSGMAARCGASDISNGRYFVGFTAGRMLNDLMAAGDMYAGHGNYAGVGWDADKGHTHWMWCSYGSNGVHQYIDTGVAVASDGPIIVIIDAKDFTHFYGEVRHGLTGALLASHTYPDTDAPGVWDSLCDGIVSCTGAAPPFERHVELFGARTWRRL